MTTILKDDERLAKEKARGLDTLPAVHFTPLNAPIDHILTLIKDDPMLGWPRRMKRNPSEQSKHKY